MVAGIRWKTPTFRNFFSVLVKKEKRAGGGRENK